MCFVIILKDGKEEVEKLLIEVIDLLEIFLDIIFDNVPNGLPPLWKISYHMGFILGADLPNKTMHKTTPTKSE